MKNLIKIVKYLLLFIPFTLIADILEAQIRVEKVIIDNSDIVNTRDLENILLSDKQVYDTISTDSKIDTLRTYFFNRGIIFKDCFIKYIPSGNNLYDLHIKITDAHNVVIEELNIKGDSNEFINNSSAEIVHSQLNTEVLKLFINKILGYYEENGFPLASIQIDKFDIDTLSASVKINLNLSRGESVKIESFKITGNEVTDEDIIVRRINIAKGGLYKKSVIEKIPAHLMKLDVFESVSKPEIYFNNRGAILGINVKETRSLSFDGILGYVPSNNPDEKGEITGLVNVSFNNLFGTARKLNLVWQRENRSSQTINLKYVEPNLASLPVKMELSFYQREQDSLYVQRNLKINNSLAIKENITGSIYLQYEGVIPGRKNSSLYFTDSKLYSIGFELLFDSRDNQRNPSNGVYNKNYVEVGTKKYSSGQILDGSKSVKKIGVDVDSYNSFFRAQILYNSFHGRMLISDNIEQTDLYYFGGINSLRGYRENQFTASSVVWLNNEYRFAFQDNTFIYPFFDVGYFKQTGTIDGLPEKEDFLYSYGLGFNIMSEIGIIRLNFSLGKEDKLSGMKVHLGFKNNF